MHVQANEISKEYEDFLYVISHDFSSPIRQVREFTKLLVNDISEGDLSQKNQEHVYFINKSVNRLLDMQTSLLELSRVTTRGSDFEDINTNLIVQNILKTIKKKSSGKNVMILSDELPEAYGDKLQIQSVFEKLISNALKFKKPDTDCKIIISGYENENLSTFFIKDNGIGIEKEYRKEVFRIFRRLNAPEKYLGIGAGLTYCKKVIERHQGKIWLDPVTTEGTKVCFSIPKERLEFH